MRSSGLSRRRCTDLLKLCWQIEDRTSDGSIIILGYGRSTIHSGVNLVIRTDAEECLRSTLRTKELHVTAVVDLQYVIAKARAIAVRVSALNEVEDTVVYQTLNQRMICVLLEEQERTRLLR